MNSRPRWCGREYADVLQEYTAYKITRAQSSRYTDREDVGQNILHKASWYRLPAPQASAFRPTPACGCTPSIASLDYPKIPSSTKILNQNDADSLTDAVRARLAFKPWSSSHAALSSGSMRPYSWNIASKFISKSWLIAKSLLSNVGVSTNRNGLRAGLGIFEESVNALTIVDCVPDGVALTIV